MAPEPLDVETLLANAGWLRRLARGLAGPDADDLVQDAWVAALRAPPDPGRPVRPWLAEVVRNLVGMARRRAIRRPTVGFEGEVVAPETGAEDLLASLELQRHLALLVAELEEPYRATVLMRFYEGCATPAIAARLGIPAGTVRWRLSEGVRRLRQRLDERARGWKAIALVGLGAGREGRWRSGAWSGAAALIVVVAALRGKPSPAKFPGAEGISRSAATAGRGPSAPPPPPGSALAGFVAAIPALARAAGDRRPYTRDELIEDCLAHRRVLLACPLQAVEDWSRGWERRFRGVPTPADLVDFRRQALDRLAELAAIPASDRPARCAESVDASLERGDPRMPRDLEARWHACTAQTDCQAASACATRVYHEWPDRPEP